MKRFILTLALLGLLFGLTSPSEASGVRGYLELAAGTTDSTIVFVSPVHSFTIIPTSAEIAVDFEDGYGGKISSIDVEATETLAPTGLEIWNITIDRTGSTAVRFWWGMNNE